MKKMLLVTSLAATLSLPALAESTEDFFYQRGYEMGYNEGFNHGVKKAYEEDPQNPTIKRYWANYKTKVEQALS